MAQRNVEWYSVDTYGVALCVRCLADLFDILVFLVVTAAKAISPKPPKIQTANGTAIYWGYDVQFVKFLLFFPLPILHLFVVIHESVN